MKRDPGTQRKKQKICAYVKPIFTKVPILLLLSSNFSNFVCPRPFSCIVSLDPILQALFAKSVKSYT